VEVEVMEVDAARKRVGLKKILNFECWILNVYLTNFLVISSFDNVLIFNK
jgi:hypothetical protein